MSRDRPSLMDEKDGDAAQHSVKRSAPGASSATASTAWRILRYLLGKAGFTRPGATTGIGLLIIWVILSLTTDNFLTTNNVLNILLQASHLWILAGGVTVTLIAAEIDLSIASIEALAGAVIAVVIVQAGMPWPLALLAGVAVGALAGVLNGFFTTRYAMPSFVTTLAMLGIARGLAFVITDGESVYGLPGGFVWIGQGKFGPVPVPIVEAALVLVALHVMLTRTKIGLNIYAVGGNPEAARLAGINVARTKMFVLILSGFTAALAGVVLAARLGTGSGQVGEADLLDAIAAVVIGGTSLFGGVGRISGTAMGVILIVSIRNGLVLLGVGAFWQPVAIGSLILAAVFLDHVTKKRRL